MYQLGKKNEDISLKSFFSGSANYRVCASENMLGWFFFSYKNNQHLLHKCMRSFSLIKVILEIFM